FSRDWSSDVCSSDLPRPAHGEHVHIDPVEAPGRHPAGDAMTADAVLVELGPGDEPMLGGGEFVDGGGAHVAHPAASRGDSPETQIGRASCRYRETEQ